MKNKQEVHGKSSFIEIIGSVLLLICMFLPWFTLYSGDLGGLGMSGNSSFSLLDGLQKLLSLSGGVSDYASLLGSHSRFSTDYGWCLFIIPALCLINPFVQYFIRLPWLSFYAAFFPTLVAMLAVGCYFYIKSSLGSDSALGGFSLGIGSILTLLMGVVMLFCSLTSLGWYYKEHLRYSLITIIWVVIGTSIFLFPNTWYRNIGLFLFCLLGMIHVPFLIYSYFVTLISVATESQKNNEVKQKTGDAELPIETQIDMAIKNQNSGSISQEFIDKARTRTNEELESIIRSQEDYNIQLIAAAGVVLSERRNDDETEINVSTPVEDSTPIITTTSFQPTVQMNFNEDNVVSNKQKEKKMWIFGGVGAFVFLLLITLFIVNAHRNSVKNEAETMAINAAMACADSIRVADSIAAVEAALAEAAAAESLPQVYAGGRIDNGQEYVFKGIVQRAGGVTFMLRCNYNDGTQCHIYGKYYYDKHGSKHTISLDGILTDGEMTLTEKDEEGNIFGTFSGRYSGNDYSGTYINKDGDKTYDFDLVVTGIE